MKKMFNPPHPGEILKGLYLEPLKLTLKETAIRLKISRKTFSDIINGKKRITPETAVKLAFAFQTSPEIWLNHQQEFDLWVARNNLKNLKIEPFFRKLA